MAVIGQPVRLIDLSDDPPPDQHGGHTDRPAAKAYSRQPLTLLLRNHGN